jgi:D-amino peptidase
MRWLPTLVLLAAAAPAGAAGGKRLFVSVDMEGIAGVVSAEQLGPPGFEYARFREFMTEEALAAMAAAREAGATEFVVADSHGNMQNLLLERMPRDVTVVRSSPRPLGMMEGIDASFDGVLFIGYHAGTTNPRGVRAHTMSSANLADLRLNGVSVPEGAWNAALAGHFGVPVLMVSGDDAAVEEVQKHVPGIEGAVVKWSLGFHAARTLTPEAARDVIREKVKAAMARRASLQPLRAKTPVEVEIRFKNYRPAEVLAYLRGVERVDAHAVRYVAKDMLEAARFLSFVLNYQPTLEP